MTLGAYYYADRASLESDTLRFQSRSHRTINAIETRMDAYIALLTATAGFFMASDSVDLNAFRSYIAKTEVQKRYPGVQGVGYTARYLPGQSEEAERDLRGLYPDFRFWPQHDLAERHAIIYLEPQDRRNKVAIGYDMFSEPVRNAAMARARDSGQPAVSGIVRLVQEIDAEVQAGFLAYVPVYATRYTPQTLQGRRELLRGFVYSPFRAADLLAGIFQDDPLITVSFDIFAGPEVDEAHLLYKGSRESGERRAPSFSAVETLTIGGQPWTVRITSKPEFHRFSQRARSNFVLVAGLIMSGLLFLLTLVQSRATLASQRSADRLERSRRALKEGEEKYRQIVETAREGIWVFDENGQTVYVNERMADMLATSTEALQRRVLSDYLPDKQAHTLLDLLGQESAALSGEDFCLKRRDGKDLWVSFSASTIIEETSRRPTTLLMVSDVTERKEYEADLIEAKERAEEIARLKSAFLANMSHEIRTPLTGIIGFSQLLAEEVTGDPRDYAESIGRSGQRLLETLNSILDLANFEARSTNEELETVAVAPFLHEARGLLQPLAARKQLDLGVVILKSDIYVEVIPIHLRRILSNLVGNAIKFTEKGEVRITLDATGGDAIISVADTGVGIAPAFLPRIFEEFAQESTGLGRSHEGTGLGLTITKRLVEIMNGQIEVESEKGKGSTFTVSIPRVFAAPEIFKDGTEGALPPGTYADKRILVVEDNEESRLLFRKILEPLSEVYFACDGEEALELLETGRFDLLLIDINLGRGMSGLDLIEHVRSSGSHVQTPAVALTAYALTGDSDKFIRNGFDAYLAKPFARRQLFDLLATYLKKRPRMQTV